jgi:hypothetical protein
VKLKSKNLLRKENYTTMNNEEKFLEITQQMVLALENPNLIMTQKQKDELEVLNESSLFFLDQGDWDRAIGEVERIIEIINELEANNEEL